MATTIESQFHDAMVDIYKKAKKECGYNASQFINMISNDGGLKTAKRLLESKEIQYGFTELWECGRLDLTVEAHILKPEFKTLFTEAEITEARTRLERHGYFESVRDSELAIKDIDKEIKSEFSRYKVLYIESRNNPVCEVNIEKELNRMLDEGWVFKQLSTGGGIEPSNGKYWVYIVFEKEYSSYGEYY